ncbi:peptidoglycan-binding protein [Sphingomonas qilianensis]|uniref:Peptidoglycan-binding protein n=1 Tax=Sphingomonas qilianensis TaxID=1736690 RepID=A0ABU9XTJ7_9SPHN
MIERADAAQAAALRRAELIYAQARGEVSDRLWQAALGSGDHGATRDPAVRSAQGMSLDTLLALTMPDDVDRQRSSRAFRRARATPGAEPLDLAAPPPLASAGPARTDLGVNAGMTDIVEAAAARTGIPAPALAAIVNAEAAKDGAGRWQVFSRNPRSSAAGLGQFLSSTWKDEAERAGTWLNDLCHTRGWINDSGKLTAPRSQLLALRYDPEASINAIADYARANVARLRAAGVPVGAQLDDIARAAYFAHHLGIGDAIKFLQGGLPAPRARHLLSAQIGDGAASRRIAELGDPVAAHRAWLLGFVGSNIRPARFAALGEPTRHRG